MNVRDTGVCAGKDTIYVVGGRGGGTGVQKLDTQSYEWVTLPEMNNGRRCPGTWNVHQVKTMSRILNANLLHDRSPLTKPVSFSSHGRLKRWRILSAMN